MRALWVSILSLAVTLGGVELGARQLLKDRWHTPTLQAMLRGTNIRSPIELDPDPELVYRLRPHQKIDVQGSLVRTDSMDKRVPHHGAPQGDNTYVVALFGDSTSFGWRVAYED